MPSFAIRPQSTPTGLLAARLCSVAPAQATLSRLVFDRRFLHWVDALTGEQGARWIPIQDAEAVRLHLQSQHGALDVSADALAWPALHVAAQSPDAAQARDVVSILLADTLAWLAGSLPGLSVASVQAGRAAEGVRLLSCGVELGLHSIDDEVADALSGALAAFGRADANHLNPLRLPCRLMLFSRELRRSSLDGLGCGDIVLGPQRPTDDGPLVCRISFGLGTTMQANAETDPTASAVTVTEPLHIAADSAPGEGPPIGDLGELSVPVSFEIDSARVSLDELAAIGPGSVLELQASANDATVLLVCYGQVVGAGQLVTVGDQLGVRITRMGAAGLVRAGARP